MLCERVIGGDVIENRVAAAHDRLGLNVEGLPGESNARGPVSVISVDERPRIRPIEKWSRSAGRDNVYSGHGDARRVQIEVRDLIVQLNRRRDRFIAQPVKEGEALVHAPVVLCKSYEIPAPKIQIWAELDARAVRQAQKKIGEVVAGRVAGQRLAIRAQLAGEEASESEIAPRHRTR